MFHPFPLQLTSFLEEGSWLRCANEEFQTVQVEKELRLNPTDGFYLSPEGPKWTHTASLLFSTFIILSQDMEFGGAQGKPPISLFFLSFFFPNIQRSVHTIPPEPEKNSEGHQESGQSYQGLPFYLSISFSFYIKKDLLGLHKFHAKHPIKKALGSH